MNGMDIDNNTLVLLKSIWTKLGNFDMTIFEGRIRFQKAVYLIKELGFNLNFNDYNWYIHGPYSTIAAHHGYNLYENWDLIKSQELSFDEIKILEKLKTILELGEMKDNSIWFELIASIRYWKKRGKSKDEVFKILNKHALYFRDEKLLEKGWKATESLFP